MILNVEKKSIPNIEGLCIQQIKEDTVLVTSDCDAYNNGKVLFKFRKNVIPENLRNTVRESYNDASRVRSNLRIRASGGSSLIKNNLTKVSTVKCCSIISGYYDRPPLYYRKHFVKNTVCRRTAFIKDFPDKWLNSIPFFQCISELYKELSPIHYEKQMNYIQQVSENYRIANTPFTTVTTNRNWQSACHKDKGDYDEGLGNLTVIGDEYEGCYLYFPEFNIAIDVRPGDFLLMDVHEYHCNTEFLTDNTKVRLSFVCYLRKRMIVPKIPFIFKGEEYLI